MSFSKLNKREKMWYKLPKSFVEMVCTDYQLIIIVDGCLCLTELQTHTCCAHTICRGGNKLEGTCTVSQYQSALEWLDDTIRPSLEGTGNIFKLVYALPKLEAISKHVDLHFVDT